MPYIFYYLTEDPSNFKERNEVSYLHSIGRVVVVTRGGKSSIGYDDGVKNLNLPSQSQSIVRAYSLWTKLCYLLARPSNSLTDRGFPSRNVYTGNFAVRWLINRLWHVKYIGFINRLLPTYETLYFAPFKLVRLFVRDKRRSSKRYQRVVVHDSLILRLTRFTPFILAARRSGLQTIANVKSWDNPFYSQFVRGASGYLTWSQSMWRDVQRFHNVNTTANHSWGPRPFYNFANAVRLSKRRPNNADGVLVIGYAAAFCDTLMAAYEVQVIAGLAQNLQERGVNAKILLRPYPIVPSSSYDPLRHYANVEIVDIQGPPTDRYGDGREIIRFGSDMERIHYLSCCHYFLSIATSFTFEAALFGLPVLQYFATKENRKTEHDLVFFKRLEISDHIVDYLLPHLPVANNATELISMIQTYKKEFSCRSAPLEIMNVMGFPPENMSWNQSNEKMISELQLAKST